MGFIDVLLIGISGKIKTKNIIYLLHYQVAAEFFSQYGMQNRHFPVWLNNVKSCGWNL